MHVPVSPADSRTEIPLSPSWPIMEQTRLAYFSGTVCAVVLVNKQIGGKPKTGCLPVRRLHKNW